MLQNDAHDPFSRGTNSSSDNRRVFSKPERVQWDGVLSSGLLDVRVAGRSTTSWWDEPGVKMVQRLPSSNGVLLNVPPAHVHVK